MFAGQSCVSVGVRECPVPERKFAEFARSSSIDDLPTLITARAAVRR